MNEDLSMVERVAMAMTANIWQQLGGAEGGTSAPGGDINANELARAAIDAMREPTEAMVTAGRKALRDGGLLPAYTDDPHNGQTPIIAVLLRENAWPAMIVASLTPQGSRE